MAIKCKYKRAGKHKRTAVQNQGQLHMFCYAALEKRCPEWEILLLLCVSCTENNESKDGFHIRLMLSYGNARILRYLKKYRLVKMSRQFKLIEKSTFHCDIYIMREMILLVEIFIHTIKAVQPP